MRPTLSHLLRRFILPILLAACAPTSVPAQVLSLGPTPQSSSPAQTAAPRAIPVLALLARADADESFANLAMERAANSEASAAAVQVLADIETSVDDKSRQFGYDTLHVLPILQLESLDRHWSFDAMRLARWKSEFAARTSPFTADAADAAGRLADWRSTRAALPADALPPALSRRIDDVMAALTRSEQQLSAPLDAQIALGRRASLLEGRIKAGRQSVENAIDDIDRRLLHLDVPPLWRASAPTEQHQGIEVIDRSLALELSFSEDYSNAALPNRRALQLIQIVLVPALLWLWWWGRTQKAGTAPSGDISQVLRRPISSWILLAMIANLALGTQAPLLVQQTAMIIALIPVYRLLPRTGRRALDWWPYLILLSYLLLRLSILLLDSGLMYRWYQLLLAAGTIGATLWLLWRAHRAPAPDAKVARRVRLVRLLAWTSVSLMAVAVLANAIGNVSLSEMLVSGVIDSGYMALMLYAALNVFSTPIRLILAQPAAARWRVARLFNGHLPDRLMHLLTWVAVIAWGIFTLQSFRLLRPVYGLVHAVLSHPFTYGEFSLSLGDLLAFVIAIVIAAWASRLMRVLLRQDVLPRLSLPRGVANSVASLAYYALLGVGLLVALSLAGFKIGQLTLLLGALGVGIGLGLQDVVRNFVSGLILMFERPVQPGDTIDVGGISGQVREIGIRATVIRTFDGADAIIPNSVLLAENLTNWTLRDRNRRFQFDLGVAYGSDPAAVTEILLNTTRSTKGISTDVPPQVLFQGFGDNALNFTVRAWTADFDNWVTLRSTLIGAIYQALTEAGIAIPFPQRDLHLNSLSDEVREALLRGAVNRTPAPPHAGGEDPRTEDIPAGQ